MFFLSHRRLGVIAGHVNPGKTVGTFGHSQDAVCKDDGDDARGGVYFSGITPAPCLGKDTTPTHTRATTKGSSSAGETPTKGKAKIRLPPSANSQRRQDQIPDNTWFDDPKVAATNELVLSNLDWYKELPDKWAPLPLPGPMDGAEYVKEFAQGGRDKRLELTKRMTFRPTGDSHLLTAELQKEWGDRGLSSNICHPIVLWEEREDMHPSLRTVILNRVIIAHPEDATRLAATHVAKDDTFKPVLRNSVISTSDLDQWRRTRRHLSPAFMPYSSLARIFPVSLERALIGYRRLGDLCNENPVVNMSDFLLHEAQAQLQWALFGNKEFSEEQNRDIRAAFAGSPETKDGTIRDWVVESVLSQKKEDFVGPSEATEKCPIKGPLTQSILTLDGETDRTRFANCLIFAFAGHDTTGHTMTWLMYELAKAPHLQNAVREEINTVLSRCGGIHKLTYTHMGEFKLLRRCITETLRLWPAVANGTNRRLAHDDVVHGAHGDQVTLPAGTIIQIPNWSRHRNKDLWGDTADKFDPLNRAFTKEELPDKWDGKVPASLRFTPFMSSPRHCIGRNFAQMEMRIIFSAILPHFEFAIEEPYRSAQNYLGVNRATLGPKDLVHSMEGNTSVGLHLRVARRLGT